MSYKNCPPGLEPELSTARSATGPSPEDGFPTADAVADLAFFAGIPLATVRSLVSHCDICSLQTGDILLSPGQINRNLYLLMSGRLKVLIDRIDSDKGFAVVPGECVGEVSVIDSRPSTAFVLADQPSRVLVISDTALWEEFLRVPQIARNFMRLSADRFRMRNEAMQMILEQQLRYEHLQKELAIAREIQCGMLPHDLSLGAEIEIAAEMTPAQQIGGDFYDVFPVSADEYCITIGDVSGKGIPASLFMVRTMALLRTEVLKRQSIDSAMCRLNAKLCAENPTSMFATLIMGILNRRSGCFRYVNAGHDPIILCETGIGQRVLPPPKGILVGLDGTARYETASVTLKRGDALVLYTDGVTEAMNAERELFTLERLLACLRESPTTSAPGLADRIKQAVRHFAGAAAPSDDLTMVIVRYVGAPEGDPD